VPTIVDDDVEVVAEFILPGAEHLKVTLVARDHLDPFELALGSRLLGALSVVHGLPETFTDADGPVSMPHPRPISNILGV